MFAATVRDIPENLHAFLKADAAANHRSFNKQVIVALDEYRKLKIGQMQSTLSMEEKIAKIQAIQSKIAQLPALDQRTADEILSYDEFGLSA